MFHSTFLLLIKQIFLYLNEIQSFHSFSKKKKKEEEEEEAGKSRGGSKIFVQGGSIRNINYINLKRKRFEYINIKKKKKILQLSSTKFHILKPLHDRFIINLTSYIFFNVHSQTIIHPPISHSTSKRIKNKL